MPHAIIAGGPEPRSFFEAFESSKEHQPDGTVLEIRAAFLRNDAEAVLVQCLTLELGPAQSFFVAVERKRKQLTVRLHGCPDVQRTPAVKEVVARVAGDVLALGGRVENTNLDGLG